jgi:hypothetical protein
MKSLAFLVTCLALTTAFAVENKKIELNDHQQKLFTNYTNAKKAYLISLKVKTAEQSINTFSPPPEDPSNPSNPPADYGTCGYGDGCEGALPGDSCDSTWVHGAGVCINIGSSGPNSQGKLACECLSQ